MRHSKYDNVTVIYISRNPMFFDHKTVLALIADINDDVLISLKRR